MVLLVYDCCSSLLHFNTLLLTAIAALKVAMSVCLLVGRSVCMSASNDFYRSVMLLVVYKNIVKYYCSLDYYIIL